MTLLDTLIWLTVGLVAPALAYLALRWLGRAMKTSNIRAYERAREREAVNSGDQGATFVEPRHFHPRAKAPATGAGRPAWEEWD